MSSTQFESKLAEFDSAVEQFRWCVKNAPLRAGESSKLVTRLMKEIYEDSDLFRTTSMIVSVDKKLQAMGELAVEETRKIIMDRVYGDRLDEDLACTRHEKTILLHERLEENYSKAFFDATEAMRTESHSEEKKPEEKVQTSEKATKEEVEAFKALMQSYEDVKVARLELITRRQNLAKLHQEYSDLEEQEQQVFRLQADRKWMLDRLVKLCKGDIQVAEQHVAWLMEHS